MASIDGCNSVIWRALLIEVALISIKARVAVALGIVVVTSREVVALLLLLIVPL